MTTTVQGIAADTHIFSESVKASGLCERICPCWRMSAGIMCLAASVMAVCCAIVWNAHWLCLPFGLSVLGAGYTIYLGYEYHNLKAFEKSNEELRQSLNTLDLQNTRLRAEIDQLERNNKQLNTTANQFENLLTQSKQTNTSHKKLISKLQEEIEELKQLRDMLQQQASNHVEQLQGLSCSLKGIQSSAGANHELFTKQLNIFSQHLASLVSCETEQAHALIETGQILKETFEAIQQWKDEKRIQRQIKQMELLQRTVEAAEARLTQATADCSKISGQIDSLRKVKASFDLALASLLEKIERLGQETESLSQIKQEIAAAAQIFKQHDLG